MSCFIPPARFFPPKLGEEKSLLEAPSVLVKSSIKGMFFLSPTKANRAPTPPCSVFRSEAVDVQKTRTHAGSSEDNFVEG